MQPLNLCAEISEAVDSLFNMDMVFKLLLRPKRKEKAVQQIPGF